MKSRLLQSWNLARLLRLLIGVAAAVQGILLSEILMLLAGGFLVFTSILNIGCCGSSGCATNFDKARDQKKGIKDVVYEEVDSGK